MAYREVAMWEILVVLERAHRGKSQSPIARVTIHSRKTVRRYLATAKEVRWAPGAEAPMEALPGGVFRRHRAGQGLGPEAVEEELLEQDINRKMGGGSCTESGSHVAPCGSSGEGCPGGGG